MGKKEEIVDLNANNEEEWDKLKAAEGLIVVDIYSKWAGPCTVMKAIIFKIKGKVSRVETLATLSLAGGYFSCRCWSTWKTWCSTGLVARTPLQNSNLSRTSACLHSSSTPQVSLLGSFTGQMEAG